MRDYLERDILILLNSLIEPRPRKAPEELKGSLEQGMRYLGRQMIETLELLIKESEK